MTSLKEEIEMMKFNCPSCPLPHNLSSREIDKLLSLLSQRIMKAIPKEIENPKAGIWKEQTLDTRIKLSVGYNEAIKEVRAIFKELLDGTK